MREALGSPHLDSRPAGGPSLELARALAAPALQARTSDLEYAHAVLVLEAEPLDDAPILDLRLRKGVRRHGLALALASPRASALDESASLRARYAPGGGAAFALALAAALRGDADADERAAAAGASTGELQALAALLRGAGGDGTPGEVVILWSERLLAGEDADAGALALLAIADALGLAGVDGGGLLEIPAHANGRGLREAGVLPHAGPGLSAPGGGDGLDAAGIGAALAAGELSSLYLLHCDPLRDLPRRELWERALDGAATVVAHASFLTEGVREHADVVFPAEAYPEKEGTLVHPDGRLQRLRPAIARAGQIEAEWRVLAELARRLGLDLGLDLLAASSASALLFDAVGHYAGMSLEEIGGRGRRWQERDAASAFPAAAPELGRLPRVEVSGDVGLAGVRSLWDAPEVEHSPSLAFLHRDRELAWSSR